MTSKIMIIIRHEYLTRIKSKGFIIGTILGPVLMLAMVFLPAFFSMMDVGGIRNIAVFDGTGRFGTRLMVAPAGNSDSPAVSQDQNESTDKQPEPPQNQTVLTVLSQFTSESDFEKAMKDSLNTGRWFGYVIISGDSTSLPDVRFYGAATSDFALFGFIEKRINYYHRIDLLHRLGISENTANQINKSVDMKVFKVTDDGAKEDSGFSFILAFSMGFIIYMSMFIYGSIVMQSAMEEKQSRIMEVIISSVKPFDLIMGKIFGIGLLALTQYLIWAGVAGVLALYGSLLVAPFTGGAGGFSFNIPISSLVAFVFYFIAGYLIFSTIYAAVGASVDNMNDAQQIISPVALLIIIPILLISLIIRDPSSALAIITSQIPFFAPILMPARIAIETPPLWELALSVALMTVTFIGMVWIAGKIYRVGVLMYGKQLTLKEISRWIRY